MKKTKIAAIVACAALLVLGMAFTAMAANKWVYEGGQWIAVDKDGDPVTGWVKGQNGNKYWADEDGVWLTQGWVDDEDKNATYYVGYNNADGEITKGWAYIEDDDEDSETYGNFYWYYFDETSGKLYTQDGTKAKTVKGAKYAIGADGRMLTGWVASQANAFVALDFDDDNIAADFADALYYCGDDTTGWANTGWQYLLAPDGDGDFAEYWFYFGTNGQIVKSDDADEVLKKTIGGLSYTFDECGRMLTGFVPPQASAASASFALESGGVVKKGWIWDIPTEDMRGDRTDLDDETYHWFWAQSNGTLLVDAFTHGKSSSKTWYALDKDGVMISGLYDFGFFDTVDGGFTSVSQLTDGGYIPEYGDAAGAVSDITTTPSAWFYFGEEATDGSMKTGSQKIELDGEEVTMLFSTSASTKYWVGQEAEASASYPIGMAVTGSYKNKEYINGRVVCGNADEGLSVAQIATCSAAAKTALIDQEIDDFELPYNGGGWGTPDEKGYVDLTGNDTWGIVKADGTIMKKGTITDNEGIKYYVKDYYIYKVKVE